MPEFETHTCENCGDEFKAIEGANAAENGYCSPKCETAND
jgi:hypothetical protein